MYFLNIFSVVAIILVVSNNAFCAPKISKNKLIYIMLDGFRYDYVDKQDPKNLPGFNQFLDEGVRASYMSPIYPSISFPDWTTLVTGLWAESHGIVGNYIYDNKKEDMFILHDTNTTDNKKWWTAEPIWTTSTKAGLKTAVILWSKCNVAFDNVLPDYCDPFVQINGYEIFRNVVDRALIKLEEGYDFIQVYNEHTDDLGHQFGPESEEVNQAVRDLDAIILHLLTRLTEMKMRDNVNIVIVSDHGMRDITSGFSNHIELDDYLPTDLVENIADSGAFANIKVKEGHLDEVYESLKPMPGVQVYRHDDIPDNLHFKNNKYIHDIILKADTDTYIESSRSKAQTPPRDDISPMLGAHGFDPRDEKMRAIFFASGPDFEVQKIIEPIQNVDVYPLIAHLLQINPLPNNGTLNVIQNSLIKSRQK